MLKYLSYVLGDILYSSDKSSDSSIFEKEKNNLATDTLIREISDIKTALEDYI